MVIRLFCSNRKHDVIYLREDLREIIERMKENFICERLVVYRILRAKRRRRKRKQIYTLYNIQKQTRQTFQTRWMIVDNNDLFSYFDDYRTTFSRLGRSEIRIDLSIDVQARACKREVEGKSNALEFLSVTRVLMTSQEAEKKLLEELKSPIRHRKKR